MLCKLIKNLVSNFNIFNLHGKKYIKIDQTLTFILTHPISKNANYCIIIGTKSYKLYSSSVIKYSRILDYDQIQENTGNFILTFTYKSGSKKIEISKTFKLPFYLNMNIKMRTNNNFLSSLKSIGDDIEFYTKEEICGVIESLINKK